MFQEYQNEIIATITIITISTIFLLMKKKSSVSTKSMDKSKSTLENREIEEPKEISPNEEKRHINTLENSLIQEIEFEGKEEGSFGIKTEEKPTMSNRKKSKIKKRSIPPHGKITKQNFSEFSGLKILVAEDNLINQKVIAGLLADSGIEITIANDGQEALDILQNSSDFKIIIMDIHMPRMDGFEATRAIRANKEYDHIVVVALSGDTALDDINKMRDAGMEEHLEKPLRMDSLYDMLYTYSAPNNESDSNEFVRVISTKELDGDKGLSICGGDEEFYREILSEFIGSYENSTNKLRELLSDDNLKEADRLLLDIIGVTANIGADSLNSIAVDIKDALKDTEEKSYFTLIEQYKLHLVALLVDIKEYL